MGAPVDDVEFFSVVDLADGDRLAGEALLWGIDLHNRTAHLGVSLVARVPGARPSARMSCGCCAHYGISRARAAPVAGGDTLVDNEAMLRAATRAGFTREGRAAQLRRGSTAAFVDTVVLGLLAEEWEPGRG